MNFQKLYTNSTGAELLKATQTLKPAFASPLLAELQQLSFTQEFGRGTAWLGERGLNYIYSGRSHIATGYTPKVELLTKWLNKTTGESFNLSLIHI